MMINGVIVYHRAADGVLTGKWTQVVDGKSDGRLGSERAVPREGDKTLAGAYDVSIYSASGDLIYAGTLQLDTVSESVVATWTPGEKGQGTFKGIGFVSGAEAISIGYWLT